MRNNVSVSHKPLSSIKIFHVHFKNHNTNKNVSTLGKYYYGFMPFFLACEIICYCKNASDLIEKWWTSIKHIKIYVFATLSIPN